MWFAFRFFIFVQRQQHWQLAILFGNCCDLLSDFLSLSNGNNQNPIWNTSDYVVICFQIFYLCPTATTRALKLLLYLGLWFAFRFFIFVQRQQPFRLVFVQKARCDLLSDFLSLSNGNNSTFLKKTLSLVVICFQIFYLCPTATTYRDHKKCRE